MNFEKIKRIMFSKNYINDYISWDGGKEPTTPRFEYKDLTEVEYRCIIEGKTQLDDMIYKAVFNYVNDDNLCSRCEGFPKSERMTGNFYVASESYYLSEGRIQGHIATHFTEMFSGGVITSPIEQDYLGLEISFILNYDGSIEITGIDSSSI